MRRYAFLSMVSCLALVSAGCSGVSTEPAETGSVTITEVLPAQGPLAGNITVQIKGTGFTGENLLVTFGGTTMTDAQQIDAQTVRGTLPARSQPGVVDVVVACKNGQATLAGGFEYHDAAPLSITGLNPPNGPVGGGTTVTITGTGFQGGATTVTFGGTGGTGVTVNGDDSLSVLTPAATGAGAVAVAVSNDNGTASLPNAFVYGDGGGGGGGTEQTASEDLGGISEFNHVTLGGDPPIAQGYAFYFAENETVFPAPGTCALDLDQLPGVSTTLDAGANVTVSQSATSLALPKDNSNGYPLYVKNGNDASSFVLGEMAGVEAPGAADLAAFNVAQVAAAPPVDYTAWLDLAGFQKFSDGGLWSKSDLWLLWGENGQSAGTVTSPVNHVQIYVVGQDPGGATHVLQCDLREGGDAGSFCVKGGYGDDICQTPGATMSQFWNAIGGPQVGLGAAAVYLYRGNRATYSLPNGANASLDVSIVKAGSLTMFE